MTEKRRLAVVGSRDFPDMALVRRMLEAATGALDVECIISGGARGVDKEAETFASAHEIQFKCYEAAWADFGASAGPRRNREIVADATYMLAFWDGNSKGTLNAIRLMANAGKGCTVYVRGKDQRRSPPDSASPETEG